MMGENVPLSFAMGSDNPRKQMLPAGASHAWFRLRLCMPLPPSPPGEDSTGRAWHRQRLFSVALLLLPLLSRFSCVQLCNPRDGSPPGSPVPGILQARTLEWVAISFSNA